MFFKKFSSVLISILFLAFPLIAQVDQQWIRIYDHKSSADDYANFVEVDASRNVYVAGISNGLIILTKYNTYGEKLWSSIYPEFQEEDNFITGIQIDASRNVYIAGSIVGPDSSYDFIIIKFNSNGLQEWAARYNGAYKLDDIAVGLVIDPSGNAYITGYNYSSSSRNDYVLIKYNTNGQQQWIRRTNGVGNGDDFPTAITIDNSRNIYVTGYSYNPPTFIDIVTVKYDSTGARLWMVSYDGVDNDEDIPAAINTDNFNNIYVTGSCYGDTTDLDFIVVKYNSSGVKQWVAKYNSPFNPEDIATAATITNSGNVYVTGYTYDLIGYSDFLTVKFNSNGSFGWAAVHGGVAGDDDLGVGIVLDALENVYVTGSVINIYSEFEINTIKYNAFGVRQWLIPFTASSEFSTEAIGIKIDTYGGVIVVGSGFNIATAYDAYIIKYNSNGTQSWIIKQDNFSNESYEDFPYATTTDNFGNIYVVGSSYDNGSLLDFVLLKYNPNGELLWIKRYDGPSHDNDEAFSVVVDASRNVYITGASYSNLSGYDIVTIKYNEYGVQQWIQNFSGIGNSIDRPVAMSIDASANIYITGHSQNVNETYDIVTIKYNSAGIQQWVSIFNSINDLDDFSTSLAIDINMNVYVAGYCSTLNSGKDYTTLKYNSSGQLLWAKYYNGIDNLDDITSAIAVDNNGDVYITGYSTSSLSNKDILTIKYTTVGNFVWENRYNGTGNSIDYPKSIFVISSGDIYVGGWSFGTSTYTDILVIKYNSAGNKLWEKRYNGSDNDYDYLENMFVDSWGNVYVGGTVSNIATQEDFVLIKYNSAGTQQWHTYYNNSLNTVDELTSIRLDNSGNIYVVGASYDSTDYSNIVTIKYSQPTFISGSVFYDINNNGIKDENEPPLTGWKIRLNGPRKDSLISDVDGKFLFKSLTTGIYTVSLVSKGDWSQTLPGGSGIYTFTISSGNLSGVCTFGNYSTFAALYNIEDKWNMLSVPLKVSDKRRSTIFGTALTSAFSFDNGYIMNDTLLNLVGYWMKFGYKHNLWIAGASFPTDTLNVKTGWNMIGGISESVPINAVTSVPAGIISSLFFGYQNGYFFADSIKPAQGYWVKVSQAGKIIINSSTSTGTTFSEYFQELSNLNRIHFTDQEHNTMTLYFGKYSNNVIDIDKFSFPPKPPSGIFDVRFEEDNLIFDYTKNTEQNIRISSGAYPIKISWELVDNNIYEILYKSSGTIKQIIDKSGSMELNDENINSLFLRTVSETIEIPDEYLLSQNYPNPFNPTTKIRYQLPRKSLVRIKIFNILGQEIESLVNEHQEPGYKSIEWNAANYPAGIYIYQLKADSFTDVRKMCLLK